MTSLEIAKLASDGILFFAICILSFRILKGPSPIANLTKLKELESSLQMLLKQADEAGQALNDELLGRRRELERLLDEATEQEKRLNFASQQSEQMTKSLAAGEQRLNAQVERLRQIENNARILEERFQAQQQQQQQQNQQNQQNQQQQVRHSPPLTQPFQFQSPPPQNMARTLFAEPSSLLEPMVSRFDLLDEPPSPPQAATSASRSPAPMRFEAQAPAERSFNYRDVPEPPSFSNVAAAAHLQRQVQVTPTTFSPLANRVEKERFSTGAADTLRRSLGSIAEAAQQTVQATSLPQHLEDGLEEVETVFTSADPRLGVLGQLTRRGSQLA